MSPAWLVRRRQYPTKLVKVGYTQIFLPGVGSSLALPLAPAAWLVAAAGQVAGVAAVAAVASHERACDLVRVHGAAGWTARLLPLTVDGLVYASSMVMLDSARHGTPVPALARWLLGLGGPLFNFCAASKSSRVEGPS